MSTFPGGVIRDAPSAATNSEGFLGGGGRGGTANRCNLLVLQKKRAIPRPITPATTLLTTETLRTRVFFEDEDTDGMGAPPHSSQQTKLVISCTLSVRAQMGTELLLLLQSLGLYFCKATNS